MTLREAVDEQDFRPIRISPVLCGYGKAICRLYRDRLEFLLLSKAGYREGDEERCDWCTADLLEKVCIRSSRDWRSLV